MLVKEETKKVALSYEGPTKKTPCSTDNSISLSAFSLFLGSQNGKARRDDKAEQLILSWSSANPILF
jgi:hypothetical protein